MSKPRRVSPMIGVSLIGPLEQFTQDRPFILNRFASNARQSVSRCRAEPANHYAGAHKAEHAVDLETGAIVGMTVQDADDGDTTTSVETLIEAAEQVEAVRPDSAGLEEVVGDKGYHSNQSLVALEAVGIRSYISELDRGRRSWTKNLDARDAVYRNRRRIRGARGQRLRRLRGERLERPCVHLYETRDPPRAPAWAHEHSKTPANPRWRFQSRPSCAS